MRLWRLKQGARQHMGSALGARDFCGPAQTRRAHCALCPANYNDSARLWPSARAEVQAFVGLLPAIVSCWTRCWCSSIVATDASEHGFGVNQCSDRPSRIHDPPDIRDKTMTNLLTTVVEGRTHRDKMIRSRIGTSRATSLETERQHCAGETDKGEAVAARGTPGENKVCRSPALRRAKPLTRSSKTLADEENAGDWSERDNDGTSSTDGEAETIRKQTRLEQSARGQARAIAKAGEDPTLSFLKRRSVSHGTEAKVQNASRAVERSYWRGFSSSNLSTESWEDKNSLGRGEL